MAIPSNWTTVPVRGNNLILISGEPIKGNVIFTPRFQRVVNADALTAAYGSSISVPLVDGTFSISLPAGDDPDVTGGVFTYTVTEQFTNAKGGTYEIEVPVAKAEEGIDLVLAANVPPNVGTPAAVVTRLEFNALSDQVSGLSSNAGSVIVRGDDPLPLGTPANTVVVRTPPKASDVKVTHVSSNKSEVVNNFVLPDNLAIGDVVMAIATTQGAGRSFTWAAPWEEVFDFNQSRTTSAAIYRIVDQAALNAIQVPTFTPSGNFDAMVLATFKIHGSTSPWPAYSAGGGRSSNTLTTPTNTGFGLNAISTSPFATFNTEYAFAAAHSGITKGPAPEITLPSDFEILVDGTTGGMAFVLGRRPGTAVPIAGFNIGITYPAGFGNANYGGAHFIVPA